MRRPLRYLAHRSGLSPSLLFLGVPFSNRWHRRRILARNAQEPRQMSTATTQAEPEQYRTDVYGTPCYRHTDPDGDQFLAAAGLIPEQGPGIYFRTSPAGASIPLADLPQFIARLHTIAETAQAEAAKENAQ
ncbi:hypothetical protein ACIBAC_15090 [Streptomyces sp. NPDC051362]|uniref:hypothetical protein n=1 Tax=Streptomyces sp. NPDC051362 TaxID=3365651 RepID=UPI0037A64782